MKANNLSISIPNKGCDKNCPYCVSKMTDDIKIDEERFIKNVKKVFNLAKTARVSSVSITSKGEPILNWEDLTTVICKFSEDFPIEVQTNGLSLLEHPDPIWMMNSIGVDIVALSFDQISDFEKHKETIKLINKEGMTSRVTFNVTDMVFSNVKFWDFIKLCEEYEVNQFSLRNIIAPNYTKENEYHKWIKENTKSYRYNILLNEFTKEIEEENKEIRFLRKLPYGAKLYDIRGISFTYFDYCIQDETNGDDIRSLIYQQDGHCYTTWNSKASRIF